MKDAIERLNKVFDSRVRLGIMSVLMVNESLSFNELKEITGVTDGNLATHLRTLEESEYIAVHKSFVGRKTNTTIRITPAGDQAFRTHIKALEDMLGNL